MAEHILKTWPNAFAAVKRGAKRFEWRRDDRGFEVGDVLVLREYDPNSRTYVTHLTSGTLSAPNELRVRVTYILRGLFDVPEGYCVMSIKFDGEPLTLDDQNTLQQLAVERATSRRLHQ